MNRYLPLALSCGLVALPVFYGAYQAFQERVFRQALDTRAVPSSAPVRAAHAPVAFDPAAIAAVLGFGAGSGRVKSAEALQLRASFVSSSGPSQALLAGAQGARFFQVGEPLPGGSVLRRIEADHVVLWRNGREEHLTLNPTSRYLVPVLAAARLSTAADPLYLRPRPQTSRETQ